MDDKISAVVGKLQQRLDDDYEVRIVDVTKNNDTVKKGISVRKNGEKIGRIYYWNGEALEAFLGDVESSPLPDIDFEMSLKKQKDNIVAILINAEANKERLKDMPHRMVEGLDLAVVYKIIFKKDSEGITSSDINNGMMAMLRVTEDELYIIAMKNTKEYYAPDIKMSFLKSFRRFMMRVLVEMLIRRKIRCGIGAEEGDSSAQFFHG